MAHPIGVAPRAQVPMAPGVRHLFRDRTLIHGLPLAAFDGDPCQASVAPFTGEEHSVGPHGPVQVREAYFDEGIEMPVRPLLERPIFATDSRHRGLAFRPGKVTIPARNDHRIARAMLGGTA